MKLDYIDFYDYLPKEDLSKFIKELKKCVRRNKITPFGSFRSRDDIDKVYNFANIMTARLLLIFYQFNLVKTKGWNSLVRIFLYLLETYQPPFFWYSIVYMLQKRLMLRLQKYVRRNILDIRQYIDNSTRLGML